MAYNPSQMYNPSTEWRKVENPNGTIDLYKLEPTNIVSGDGGSYALGGKILEAAKGLSYAQAREKTGLDVANQIYNMLGTPEAYTSAATPGQDTISQQISKTFSEFDPNNTTDWKSQLPNLVSQASNLYGTRGDKAYGDVWNTYRYNNLNSSQVESLRNSLNPTSAIGKVIDTRPGSSTLGLMVTPWTSQNTNNRSLISSTPQAGYIKGYDTNNNYSEVYVPKGVYVPGISATPKQGMTASNLGTTVSGVNVPGATGGTDLASSMVAGGTAVQNLISQLNVPQTETEKMQQQILNQSANLTGQLAQKSADQLVAEQSAGIPELQKQLSNINGQIATKTAEYNALQTANQNKPITMNSIIGNDRAILNAKASDIGLLTAQAQALQGNLSVAQDTVNRAIDLKYDTITNQLAVYQAQLNAIQPILTKEEKAQAQAQQILITQYENTLKDSKTNEQNIQKLVLDYISDMSSAGKTPSQSVISQIQGSKDYNTALGIYASAAPLKKQTGGTVETPEEKEIKAFREDAAKLVGELDTKKTTWGSAYDQLRIKYPKATPDTINSMLGGGIPYNPTTGTFDTSKAWGRAK